MGKGFNLNLSREMINTLHIVIIGPALIYLGSQIKSEVRINKNVGLGVYITGIVVMLYHYLRLNKAK